MWYILIFNFCSLLVDCKYKPVNVVVTTYLVSGCLGLALVLLLALFPMFERHPAAGSSPLFNIVRITWEATRLKFRDLRMSSQQSMQPWVGIHTISILSFHSLSLLTCYDKFILSWFLCVRAAFLQHSSQSLILYSSAILLFSIWKILQAKHHFSKCSIACRHPLVKPRFLDLAKVRYGGRFHETAVDDVRTVGSMLALFASLLPYWIVYFQVLVNQDGALMIEILTNWLLRTWHIMFKLQYEISVHCLP